MTSISRGEKSQLKAVGSDPKLVPHGSDGEIEELVKRVPAILDQLKTLRDQRIAHNDALPEDATILMGQMDQKRYKANSHLRLRKSTRRI